MKTDKTTDDAMETSTKTTTTTSSSSVHESAVVEGWLYKQSASMYVPTLQRRWFSLRGAVSPRRGPRTAHAHTRALWSSCARAIP
eukprot:5356395-Prymnesium_polylepis.1